MNGSLPEIAADIYDPQVPRVGHLPQNLEGDSAARKPPVIHKVSAEFADFPVKPAMCGFIIKPSNHVSMPQAIVERARDCQAVPDDHAGAGPGSLLNQRRPAPPPTGQSGRGRWCV